MCFCLKIPIILFLFAFIINIPNVLAAKDFNIKNGTQSILHINGSTSNVGIGTNTPQGGFVVTNGNVGIGTWTANGKLIISGGNVGIGTNNPGAVIDMETSQTTLMRFSPVNHASYIAFGSNGSGAQYIDLARLTGGATLSIRTTPMNTGVFTTRFGLDDVGNITMGLSGGNVGIGTSLAQTGVSIMNGNVGIGTWKPVSTLAVMGGVGVGTGQSSYFMTTTVPNGGLIVENNVGIGTTSPQTGLAVMGNVGLGTWTASTRLDTDGFRLSTSPASGYVLVSGSTGIGTWMAPASIGAGSSQWTTTNTNDVYLPSNGNVGLGTTFTTRSALTIMNGNVGIGTFAPSAALVIPSGRVGIGLQAPYGDVTLHVQKNATGPGGATVVAAFEGGSGAGSAQRLIEAVGNAANLNALFLGNSHNTAGDTTSLNFGFSSGVGSNAFFS